MNPARRATPDSEAVASSEDERPWPSSTSFGSLPRKEGGGLPGLPGGIWSTQRRGSYKMSEPAPRNIARDSRLGVSAQSGLRAGSTPSPAASEGAGSLPFSIPLQPTPKTGRSLSHSQGQREAPQPVGNITSAADHALPLGLLAEEADADTESDFGSSLTHTMSHQPPGALQRSSTFSTSFEQRGLHHDSDEGDDNPRNHKGDARLEAAFANLSFDHPHRRAAQWQSHLGWDDLPNANESRRHSLADIPTRRGSLVGGGPVDLLGNGFGRSRFDDDLRNFDFQSGANPSMSNSMNRGFGDAPPTETFNIPATYRVPHVDIAESDRSGDSKNRDVDGRRESMAMRMYPGGAVRPRKVLIIVSFKCSRVDVFYLLENTGLVLRAGDIVIVEADRGQDLGTVQHVNVTPDEARTYKRKYAEEQYKWLMMFSENNQGTNVNPNAILLANAPATMQGLPRDNYNNLKPKAIKRLASPHEIKMLQEKEGNEAKAKRTCQQKVSHLRLQMEILDAEWQWDFQKLIFYYYADHYINFKDLITDLYRIYKTRIWLSAVNPASFSQHAMGQPPSGIGPGAITNFGQDSNTSYTMRYGQDPDPYGAVPPYQIGYDTYTPNYPGIPGMPNSFAPNADNRFTATANNFVPSNPENAPPGAGPNRNMMDYNQFYERGGRNENARENVESPTSGSFGPPSYGNYGPGGQGQDQGGFHPGQGAQWGFSPDRPTHPNASGLGRQAQLPLPIGSRSYSTSGNSGTQTSQEDDNLNARMSNLSGLGGPPAFGAFPPQNPHSNGGGMSDTSSPTHTNPRSENRRSVANNGHAQVKSYLQTLPPDSKVYADDMSRER